MHDVSIHPSLRVVTSGTPYFDALRSLIRGARKVLHLQVYILAGDHTGRSLAGELIEAAGRGVQVFLMTDAYGSGRLDKDLVGKMKRAGIRFRRYGRINFGRRWQLGRRLHQKVAVADRSVALIGGINISDSYSGYLKKEWLDFAVLVEGGLCGQVHDLCEHLFRRRRYLANPGIRFDEVYLPADRTAAKLLRNDWLGGCAEISRSYREAFGLARSSITIVASYFVPGRRIRKRLSDAAGRGVAIRVVLSAESDVPLVRRATNYLYRWMARCHIRVYEYRPSVVHGKIAVVDGRWCTVGSYNLNHLSDYGSIELNLGIRGESVAGTLERMMDGIVQNDCRLITPDYVHRRRFSRFLDWLSYVSLRVALRVLLYFTRRGR